MKCWNSAFNAEGSKLIIVAVLVAAVEIYVTAVEAGAQEKGKTGWNSVYNKNWWFSEFYPLLNANGLFGRLKKKSHPIYDQTLGFGAVFRLLYG